MAKSKAEEVTPEVSDSTTVEFEEIEVGRDALMGIPFKFALVGDAISGTYLRNRKIEEHGDFRAQIAYDLRMESDGRVFAVFGNSDLNAKMQRVRTGSFVIIEYIGDEPIEGRADYNPRKLFSVKVAKGKSQPGAPAQTGPRKVS